MNKVSIIIAGIYFSLTAIFLASELYTRLFDRGNSAMAGLVTYLLTTPSSFLIEWVANFLFGIKIGGSDAAFVTILSLSMILNSLPIYMIVNALSRLFLSAK